RLGLDRPAVRALVVACGDNARAELDVAAQVELARNVVKVGSNLRRTGIALARLPFGRQLARKEVAVDVALRIAARAGIPVPIPCSAEVATRFEHARRQAQAIAQAVQLIEPCEACADDDGVQVHRYCSRITEPNSSPGATSPCSPSSIVTRKPLPVKRNGCAYASLTGAPPSKPQVSPATVPCVGQVLGKAMAAPRAPPTNSVASPALRAVRRNSTRTSTSSARAGS